MKTPYAIIQIQLATFYHVVEVGYITESGLTNIYIYIYINEKEEQEQLIYCYERHEK